MKMCSPAADAAYDRHLEKEADKYWESETYYCQSCERALTIDEGVGSEDMGFCAECVAMYDEDETVPVTPWVAPVKTLLEMQYENILMWVRRQDVSQHIAWGYFLAIENQLEPYKRQNFMNIFWAQRRGVSA